MVSMLGKFFSVLSLVLPRWFRLAGARRRVGIAAEVRSGDEAAVNARMEAWEKGLRAVALTSSLLLLGGCWGVPRLPPPTGCETRILRMEHEGVKGWFVPDARMEGMMLMIDGLYEGGK